MMQGGYVYILFNKKNGTLYVGVTSELLTRMSEHKAKSHSKSFTAKYDVDKLGYYETFARIEDAIVREKQMKAGSRKNKIALIVQKNPEWNDLYQEFLDETIPAEHWTPECAGMAKDDIKKYNSSLRNSQ